MAIKGAQITLDSKHMAYELMSQKKKVKFFSTKTFETSLVTPSSFRPTGVVLNLSQRVNFVLINRSMSRLIQSSIIFT